MLIRHVSAVPLYQNHNICLILSCMAVEYASTQKYFQILEERIQALTFRVSVIICD